MTVRTRIAPSPTGMPHIGTIFQALINFIIARQNQGKFIVRIEDTDQTRLVPQSEAAIFEALDWFGLTPDESPLKPGKFGPYRQSERLDLYRQYAQQLIHQGDAYYCFCSPKRLDQVRQDMQQQGLPPMYDRHCRHLDPKEAAQRAAQEPHVIRLKVPPDQQIVITDAIRGDIVFDSNVVDDQVLLKSDGFPTYHLAVVVDDHLMKITHMVRGEEWLSSSPKHALLYRFFNWQPPVMIHTPLLRNPDKSKLSKRHGHASVSWYQQEGYLPQAVLNFLASRVWNHPHNQEIYSLSELINLFQLSHMHIQGPIVDLEKLNWYNGIYIRQVLSPQELANHLKPFLPQNFPLSKLPTILPLVRERLVKLSDITDLTDFFYQDVTPNPEDLIKKSSVQEVASQLKTTINALTAIKTWNHSSIEKVIRHIQAEKSWAKGQYFMMLRLAITGKKATPPLFETIAVLGKKLTLKRLNSVQISLTQPK